MEEIGFPEGQLVPHGLSYKAARKVGNAFWCGENMKAMLSDSELTPIINRIIDVLEEHSFRGTANTKICPECGGIMHAECIIYPSWLCEDCHEEEALEED